MSIVCGAHLPKTAEGGAADFVVAHTLRKKKSKVGQPARRGIEGETGSKIETHSSEKILVSAAKNYRVAVDAG
jgi:hypothetical protein